ncbi:MAG TPA: polysaccharide biosynthesis C-terminal domain-containing protein, partial [Patescibacteria group bacterium]|nr:polysaccharide biosynthesis C-terminal domain-containing protein [Patescibacteria group bacterium]
YKITYAFQFFPLALMAVLYPKFSEYFVTDKKKLAFVFERGIKYLLIIVMPITFGIGVLANDIIRAFFSSEYINSILPLKILLVGLVFSYISFPVGAFLNACNRQVTQTVIVGSVMTLNIILNILLIPKYGVVGASYTALVGNVFLTILGYIFVPKIAEVSHSYLAKSVFQIGISGLVMAIVVWGANIYYHFIFAIIVGALVYTMMLFVTGAVTRKQVGEAVSMVRG